MWSISTRITKARQIPVRIVQGNTYSVSQLQCQLASRPRRGPTWAACGRSGRVEARRPECGVALDPSPVRADRSPAHIAIPAAIGHWTRIGRCWPAGSLPGDTRVHTFARAGFTGGSRGQPRRRDVGTGPDHRGPFGRACRPAPCAAPDVSRNLSFSGICHARRALRISGASRNSVTPKQLRVDCGSAYLTRV